MIAGISGSPAAAQMARSVDALSAMLQATQGQTMDLAEKLLRIQAQQSVQDSSLGTLVDTLA